MKQLRTIPWLTQGAVQFLDGYLQPAMRVLEFGMGGSTLWMAPRCNLISVEHDHDWARHVGEQIPESAGWQGHVLPRPYHTICECFDDDAFDLVLIDGRDRMFCLEAARRIVKVGGYIMLDNAERRNYWKVYTSLMNEWIETASIQRQPDSLGFMYDGWTTTWWQKPLQQEARNGNDD